MKKFIAEFKEFALRGSVIDLAVGVIIGAAFQGIVSSLTNDILGPIIGAFIGGQPFADFAPSIFGVPIGVGAFITAIVNFLITAFIIFIMIKGMNKLAALGNKNKVEKAPDTKACPYCFTVIDIRAVRCPNCTAELSSEEAVKA